MRTALLALFALLSLAPAAVADAPLQLGRWRAWLGWGIRELPFGLEFSRDAHGALHATVINGPERIDVPTVMLDGRELLLRFDHYDSEIRARLSSESDELDGQWLKVGRDGSVAEMAFHAAAGQAHRFRPHSDICAVPRVNVAGTWRLVFDSDHEACVARFDVEPGAVTGTILTPTGDLRYLVGDFTPANHLRLSCFDGAHAFLFVGHARPRDHAGDPSRVVDDATMSGDFWSGATYHDTWTAVRDPTAELPDAFTQTTTAQLAPDLASLTYTDLDGHPVSLADLKHPDRPMIVELFGSWCPNCHDAAADLAALQKQYRKAGLVVVGLAFEYTDEFERSARQVRAYAKRHDIDYPLLIAGVAKKETVAAAFPLIDQLRAFPTTVFIDANGHVRAVHTGYAGPATGAEHAKLKAEFDRLTREMLDEVIK